MHKSRTVTGWIVGVLVFIHAAQAANDRLSDDILDNPRLLEAYVSKVVTNRMQKGHVPGAVVTIVRGNKVVFNKGYGFANLAQSKRVDPEKTLFRIASVSKVFNAMAAMMLVDRGEIGLNEDVRPRLLAAGLVLDNTVEGPVTLRGLLTHSAGIRELYIPKITLNTDPAKVLPIGAYLRKCLPLRWHPPGEAGLYTDHGITLAGYVIEEVSGKKFQNFVEASVMRPLGMKHSHYARPGEPLTDVAVGYSHTDAGYEAAAFCYTSIDPAIGVLTTGSDMGRLIIAHLTGKPRLFDSNTMKIMHESQYSDDPRLGYEWTCGFFKMGSSSESFLMHHGAALEFASLLMILPRAQIGCFIAQNSESDCVFHIGDLQALVGKPASTSSSEPAEPLVLRSIDGSDLAALAGTYVSNRDLSRGSPVGEHDHVGVKYIRESNALEVTHWHNRDQPLRFVETEHLYFHATQGKQRISFRKSPDGKRMYLFDFNFSSEGQHTRISSTNSTPSPKPDRDQH
jgi:CubicO group peptidase (beta-lactamase class C family)